MTLASPIRAFLLGVALLLLAAGRLRYDCPQERPPHHRSERCGRRHKIKYLTSAGELSLPKSIVDHVEKGGAVPMAALPGPMRLT